MDLKELPSSDILVSRLCSTSSYTHDVVLEVGLWASSFGQNLQSEAPADIPPEPLTGFRIGACPDAKVSEYGLGSDEKGKP